MMMNDQAHPDTHLFITYEDLYKDTQKYVRLISDFLQISVTEEVLEKVIKNSSLNEMKVSASIGLNHLRKGGYGGWRSTFSVALSEFFDDVSTLILSSSTLISILS